MTMLRDAVSDYVPIIAHSVFRGVVIFIAALGVVYIVGRMLGLVERPQSKNAIALIVMVLLSYWSIHIYDLESLSHPYEVYWMTVIYTTVAAILYVLAGFDLYDRFNAWCDRRFGPARKNTRKSSK